MSDDVRMFLGIVKSVSDVLAEYLVRWPKQVTIVDSTTQPRRAQWQGQVEILFVSAGLDET